MNPPGGRARLTRNLLWLAVLVALMAATLVVGSGSGGLFKPSRETPVVDVVREASPAVVNITAELIPAGAGLSLLRQQLPDWMRSYFRLLGGEESGDRKLNYGSGIMVNPRGGSDIGENGAHVSYILTNEHVVVNTAGIMVTLADGRTVSGEVWGAEPSLDVAVVKIETKEALPYLEKGRSDDLMIGEPVVAIGNPLGLGHTCSSGIISALGRTVTAQNRIYRDVIQIDAAVNPGNSGGPLLNIQGELIGITAALSPEAEGIGFAIPIDKAWAVVTDLIQYRYVPTGWLGVSVEDLGIASEPFNLRGQAGVFVTEVAPDGPAAAVLKPGDILESWNGQSLAGVDDFVRRARKLRLDEEVKLTRNREGDRNEVKLAALAFPERLAEDWAWWHLGLQAEEGELQLQTGDGRTVASPGVFVKSVAPNSPAQAYGLIPGDLLLRLNRVKLSSLTDFRQAIAQLRGRDNIFLRAQRGRFSMSMTVPLRGGGERW